MTPPNRPSYYLCIDGGGTKTSAYVAYVPIGGREPICAVGNAGPSNLTFGLDACLAATRDAVQRAVEALREKAPDCSLSFPQDGGFQRIWAAYAGCARASDRELLLGPLTDMLGPLRLTSDAELLTSPAGGERFMTLICGTGSLALLWEPGAEGPKQMARSGGWGPLLADDGSGWALGKEAVKSVLSFAANGEDLRPWHHNILAHFGLDAGSKDRLITKSSQLDPVLSPVEGDAQRKIRIASCSRIVVLAAEGGDDEALRLLRVVAGQVCDILRPLVERLRTEGGTKADTMLVVAGGLGQVDVFWNQVEDLFIVRGWKFDVVKMPEPGWSGLQALVMPTL